MVLNPLHMKVLARAESAEEVRAVLRGWLAGRVAERELGDAELVATELVTNSVRHAGLSSRDVLRVRASADGEVLHLEVEDDGPRGQAAAPRARTRSRAGSASTSSTRSRSTGACGATSTRPVWVELPCHQAG